MTEPYRLTLTEMSRRIQGKKLSPVDLAESLLKRINLLEPSIQAWVTIDRTTALR